MRVLFSSTRGAGHLQPLLPYARALAARGHEVAVAAPIELSETLRDAGFPHFVFDRPGEDVLEPIWARLNAVAHDEAAAMAIAAGEVFGGVNAVTAVPKLQLAISTFAPQLIVRDSVEEKIVQLQEQKRALVTKLVSTETGFFKSLSRDDVNVLFS